MADLVWLLLGPSVSHNESGSGGYSYTLFNFADSFGWLTAFVRDVILAGISLAAFRWVSRTWLAVPAAAIAYVVLDRPAVYVLGKLLRSERSYSSEWLLSPQSFLLPMLWVLLLFTGIALALRWVRPTWFALLTGAVAGALLDGIVVLILRAREGDLTTSLFFLPFDLLSMAVFALVFYGLLRLTSGPSLGQGDGNQRISRGFFLGTPNPFGNRKEHDAMNENHPTESRTPLFLYIPVSRLILLSIASFSLYEAYWIYKNWRYIKERDGLNIRPFWRGFFGIFFCHSLLRRIHEDKDARSVEPPTFSAGGLATGWVVLLILANIVGRAPSIAASIISAFIPSFLCLVPVQNYINAVEDKRNPRQRFYAWSSGHVVCLVFGIIVWALLLTGLGAE